MVENRASDRFLKLLSPCGILERRIYPAVALTYLDFANTTGKGKDSLVSKADSICERSLLPGMDKSCLKDAQSYLSSLNLKESEYLELGIQILTSGIYSRAHLSSSYYLSETVSLLLDIQPSDVVFDQESGVGSFLAASAQKMAPNLIRPTFIGQEINSAAADVSMLLMDMAGVNYQIENVDSLEANCPRFTKGYVFPPFGLRMNHLPATSFLGDFNSLANSRTSTEWLFVLKALQGMADNGRLVAVLPESALFRSQDMAVRRYILENRLLEAVVSLPNGTFLATGIKTDLVLLSRGNPDFKMIDGEKLLRDLPQKGISSHEAAVDIYNAVKDSDAQKFTAQNVSSQDYVLTLASLTADSLYAGLKDLVQLKDVVDIVRGSPKTLRDFRDQVVNQKTPYRIFASSNIENGLVDFDSLPYIADGKPFEKFAARKGDVVLTTKSTKVKAVAITLEPESMIIVTGGMIILRPKSDRIDSLFLQMFLESETGKKILASVQRGIVISNISVSDLCNIRIPCPPLEKQRETSKKYHSLLIAYDERKRDLEVAERKIASFSESQLHEER